MRQLLTIVTKSLRVARPVSLVVILAVLLLGQSRPAFADNCNGLYPLDCNAIYSNGGINWVPDNGSGGACGAGSTTLSGSDNIAKIFNYFVGKGLSAAATAGIMGNMQAESHFDPSIEQTPGAWEDLSTNNINNGGKGGVGLVQWDGGRRPAVINYMLSNGLTDADFHQPSDKLLGAELDYVWQELNTSYKDSTLTPLQAATTPDQAALIFHTNYEGSADNASQIQGRINNAIAIYNQYGGGATSATPTTGASTSGGCASLSPVCTGDSATGVAKILCAAEAYDTVSYVFGAGHSGAAVWHSGCPSIGPNCSLDCSGLVNIAIYDAFGVDSSDNTDDERSDNALWQVIPLSQIQPGDLIQPDSGHVEIIDHRTGDTIYTFGAHTDGVPQPDMVGPASYDADPNYVYLHYVGTGV